MSDPVPNVQEVIELEKEPEPEPVLTAVLGIAFFSGYPGWPGIIDNENQRFIFFDETNTFQPLNDKNLTLGKFNIHRATKIVGSKEIRFDERGLPVEGEFREQLRKAYKWAILEFRRIQKLTACKICRERIEKRSILCEKCFHNFHIECLEEENKDNMESPGAIHTSEIRNILGPSDVPLPPPPPPPPRHTPLRTNIEMDKSPTIGETKLESSIEKKEIPEGKGEGKGKEEGIVPPPQNNNDVKIIVPPPPAVTQSEGSENTGIVSNLSTPLITEPPKPKYIEGEWICDSCKLLEIEKKRRVGMKKKKKKLPGDGPSPMGDEDEDEFDDEESDSLDEDESNGKADRASRRKRRIRKAAMEKDYDDNIRDEDEFIMKKGERRKRKKKKKDDDDFYEDPDIDLDDNLKLNLKLTIPSPKKGKTRKKPGPKPKGRKGKRGKRGKGKAKGKGKKRGKKGGKKGRSRSRTTSSEESGLSESQSSASGSEDFSSDEDRRVRRKRSSRKGRKGKRKKRNKKRPRRETRASLKEIEGMTGRQIKRRKLLLDMDKEEIVDRYMLKREETVNLRRSQELYESNNRVLKLWFKECKNGLGELYQDLTSLEPYDLESISIQQFSFAVKQHQDIIDGAKEWSGGLIHQIQTILQTLRNADDTISLLDQDNEIITQHNPEIRIPPSPIKTFNPIQQQQQMQMKNRSVIDVRKDKNILNQNLSKVILIPSPTKKKKNNNNNVNISGQLVPPPPPPAASVAATTTFSGGMNNINNKVSSPTSANSISSDNTNHQISPSLEDKTGI